MDDFLTLSPELIATGKVTRDQLTNLIYKAAKACNLDPIEKLRFYRELEKAAGNAVKMDDRSGVWIIYRQGSCRLCRDASGSARSAC